MPEVPMVREAKTGVLRSIVTVAPSAIITLSPAVGTTPPFHVVDALHSPPVVVDVIVAPAFKRFEVSLKTPLTEITVV